MAELKYIELIVFNGIWFYADDIPERYREIHKDEYDLVDMHIPVNDPDEINFITNMVEMVTLERMLEEY